MIKKYHNPSGASLCVRRRRLKYQIILSFFLVFVLCSTNAVCESNSYYEFDASKLLAQGNLPNIFDYTNDAPAGKHGRVIAKGDKLFFEDGVQAKFWGVGLTFSGSLPAKFPPEKKDAKAIVNKLLQYGFNHVRFVGLDNMGAQIYHHWKKTGNFDYPLSDRLDYFVYELRKAGIYYSFSINNSSLVYLDGAEGVRPNSSALNSSRRYWYIRLFDDYSVGILAKWMSAFYSHINKYTGLSLANDPANVYVSAVNEDSIFAIYSYNFKYLDNAALNLLTRKFNEYLIKKYSNNDILEKSWHHPGMPGLGPLESLNSHSVKLLTAKKLLKYSASRRNDTFKFLVDIDYKFSKTIKDALVAVGYKGLFTGTNDWLGYGNLLSNHMVGNYIEMHGYFDLQKQIKFLSKNDVALSNKSYLLSKLSGVGSNKSFMSDYAFPLSNTFMAALADRPMIISEWNHSIWDDYAYEGILMMTAYSSLQGYSALDAHTYFNHPNPDPEDHAARTTFTVSNNPLFLALSPSSSLAFLRGYISESQYSRAITIAKNYSDFVDFALSAGIKHAYKEPLSMGFVHKLRTKLISNTKNTPWSPPVDGVYVSDTGEIRFDQSKKAAGTISIDAAKYKAFFGTPSSFVAKSGNFSVKTTSHGAVTVVSLDGRNITESKKILVTVAQSFRNSGENILDTPWQRIIIDTGRAPTLLKKFNAEVFIGNHNHVADVSYVSDSGKLVSIHDYDVVADSMHPGLRLRIGAWPSPWYLLDFH